MCVCVCVWVVHGKIERGRVGATENEALSEPRWVSMADVWFLGKDDLVVHRASLESDNSPIRSDGSWNRYE